MISTIQADFQSSAVSETSCFSSQTFLVLILGVQNELKEQWEDLILLCTSCTLISNVKNQKYLVILKDILIEK